MSVYNLNPTTIWSTIMRKSSDIKKSVNALGRNTKSLRDKYHAILCEVAGHTFEHGDPRLFDTLIEGAGGMNRKQLIKWITANGFARVTKDGCKINKTALKEADFANGDDVMAYLLEQAKWYEGEPTVEQIIKDLDVQSLIAMAIKKMDDAEEKGAKVVNKDPEATSNLIDLFAERVKRAA